MPALASYTPLPLIGGSESASVSASTSSSDDKKDLIDFADIKELMKNMLPSDAKIVMAKASKLMNFINSTDDFMKDAFSNELTSMYMDLRAFAEHAHQNYEDAQQVKTQMLSKGNFAEYAQDAHGNIYYMDKKGRIKTGDLEAAKKGRVLTYGDIYDLRRKSLTGAFSDSMMQSLAQSTSTSEVMATVDGIIDKIGSQTMSNSYYTRKVNNQVAKGLEAMLQDARNGVYKLTESSVGASKEQKTAAINALIKMLPNNQRNFINLKSKIVGSTPEEFLYELIVSRDKSTYKREVSKDTDFDTLAEKEAAEARKAKKETEAGQAHHMTAARAINENIGDKKFMTFSNGNDNNYGFQAIVNSVKMRVEPGATGMMKATDFLSDKEQNVSGSFHWGDATFAGANVPLTSLGEFVVSDNSIYTAYLPYKVESDGRIKPDYDMLDNISKKDKVLVEMGIDKKGVNSENYQQVNNELHRRGIDLTLDENGKPEGQFMRFGMISAQTGRKTIDGLKGISSNLYKVEDNTALAKRVAETTGVSASNDTVWPFSYLSADEVIEGVIYVPVNEDAASAMMSSGEPIHMAKEYFDVPSIKFAESRRNRASYVSPNMTPGQVEGE